MLGSLNWKSQGSQNTTEKHTELPAGLHSGCPPPRQGVGMSRPSPHGPQEHSCCHAPQIHGWASRVRPQGRGPSTSCEIPQPLQTPAGQREIQVLPLLAFPKTGTGTDTAPCIPAEEHRCPGRDLITTTCPGSATGLPGSHHRPSSGDFSPGQKSPKHKAPPPPHISISRYQPRSRQHCSTARSWGRALGSCTPGCD